MSRWQGMSLKHNWGAYIQAVSFKGATSFQGYMLSSGSYPHPKHKVHLKLMNVRVIETFLKSFAKKLRASMWTMKKENIKNKWNFNSLSKL
jgi:hypothetical protein